jgi:hypothetical protein
MDNNKNEIKQVKKTIISQRNTQVVIEKKITVKVGDKIEYISNFDDSGNIKDYSLYHNDDMICKLKEDELIEFIELFMQNPI